MGNLNDLNSVLFDQLNALNDKRLTGEELEETIKRSETITKVGDKIIQNASLVLKAYEFNDSKWNANTKVPELFGGEAYEQSD